MFQYPKYLIKEGDKFQPENFPSVMDEMTTIKEQTRYVSPAFKADIIVSYLKDHSLDNNWISANPELAKLISTGSLSTSNIEALFESCRNKPFFRNQMEEFLRQDLSV